MQSAFTTKKAVIKEGADCISQLLQSEFWLEKDTPSEFEIPVGKEYG